VTEETYLQSHLNSMYIISRKCGWPSVKSCWIRTDMSSFDWCCFYYFIRNSLVALLEALFARIFCRSEVLVYYHFFVLFFVYAESLSSTKTFSTMLLCPSLTIPPVLVCDCLYMCVWKCVIKLININKYKQNRDDVTCNIKIEI